MMRRGFSTTGAAAVSGFVSKVVLLRRAKATARSGQIYTTFLESTVTEARRGVPLVELARVTARYGTRHAPSPEERAPPPLDAVSLSVRAGEIAALLGANGAGKSTLLRVAAGLLVPEAGMVRIGGRDAGTLDRRATAREVAFVPQSEAAAVGFRVREVVAMGRAPHQSGWMHENTADRAAVDEALIRCDLGRVASRKVETLSGGEQRRVAVARALAARPRVLLLDEPGAFLDVRHRLEQTGLLMDLARRDHLACIVSMHDLDAAARTADRVVLLRDGRVVAAGPPAEVMTTPLLRATFDAEVDVGVHAASGRLYFVPLRAGDA
jgi:iron complex transport system ATP-binding protein